MSYLILFDTIRDIQRTANIIHTDKQIEETVNKVLLESEGPIGETVAKGETGDKGETGTRG